jgi:hypothetical protein
MIGSGNTDAPSSDPLGVLHHSHTLAPGQSARFAYLLCIAHDSRQAALEAYRSCPGAARYILRSATSRASSGARPPVRQTGASSAGAT